jgi:hypothetical protein
MEAGVGHLFILATRHVWQHGRKRYSQLTQLSLSLALLFLFVFPLFYAQDKYTRFIYG